MKVSYYEDNKIDLSKKSIFLAGPTPRSADVKSWRPEAIEILEKIGFDGEVFVPESSEKNLFKFEYAEIVEWELDHLDKTTVICFWIPRDLVTMPALTTNVEFGHYVESGRVVYGRPDNAPKNRYLNHLYQKYCHATPLTTLAETLQESVKKANEKK